MKYPQSSGQWAVFSPQLAVGSERKIRDQKIRDQRSNHTSAIEDQRF